MDSIHNEFNSHVRVELKSDLTHWWVKLFNEFNSLMSLTHQWLCSVCSNLLAICWNPTQQAFRALAIASKLFDVVVMLLRDTLSSMLSTANCWKHGRMAVKCLRFCCARCVTAWTERVLYVVNNVTERLSVLVAATSAIFLLNASKLLAIVGNGTHPMKSTHQWVELKMSLTHQRV